MKPANIFNNFVFTHFVKVAVLPSALLFSLKIIGMFTLAYLYNINYSLTEEGIIFSDFQKFIWANDISTIGTFLVVFAFTTWLLFKGFFFHKTHIHPKLSAWLLNQDLNYLVSGSLDLFIRMFIWLSFNWLVVLIVLIHYLVGVTSPWVLYTTSTLTTLATVVAIIDIEKDYKLYAKEKLSIRINQTWY